MPGSREEGQLDDALLERLYVKLEKPMFNVVYRWVWDAEEAQDITQEAFVRVWNARERVDVATVEALLFRTALNVASNRRRSRKLWGWLGIEAPPDVPSKASSADEALDTERTRARVRAAVEALPDKLRRVIMLAEYAELSYGEIAAVLDIPEGTVGSRRNAALGLLAKALGGIEESPA